MKKLLLTLLALAAFIAYVPTGTAASGGKEITLTGQASCAKCGLKMPGITECQNALTVEKDGKKTVYLIVDNETSKAFHQTVCKTTKEATVTAVCKKVGDHLELTASKIEEKK